LQYGNNDANGDYMKRCAEAGLKPHPARFPTQLPEFFMKYLTDPGDLVVDIFGGSNTTGFVAEQLRRYWLSFEIERRYLEGSKLRFLDDPGPSAFGHPSRVRATSGQNERQKKRKQKKDVHNDAQVLLFQV
jgi:site-specific DNA-methyltransferase (cytosine-N4-specific)